MCFFIEDARSIVIRSEPAAHERHLADFTMPLKRSLALLRAYSASASSHRRIQARWRELVPCHAICRHHREHPGKPNPIDSTNTSITHESGLQSAVVTPARGDG